MKINTNTPSITITASPLAGGSEALVLATLAKDEAAARKQHRTRRQTLQAHRADQLEHKARKLEEKAGWNLRSGILSGVGSIVQAVGGSIESYSKGNARVAGSALKGIGMTAQLAKTYTDHKAARTEVDISRIDARAEKASIEANDAADSEREAQRRLNKTIDQLQRGFDSQDRAARAATF